MPDAFEYWAFITYSHADEQAVAKLHRRIERYRLPRHIREQYDLARDRLFPLFRDRDELAASSDLTESIRTALR